MPDSPCDDTILELEGAMVMFESSWVTSRKVWNPRGYHVSCLKCGCVIRRSHKVIARWPRGTETELRIKVAQHSCARMRPNGDTYEQRRGRQSRGIGQAAGGATAGDRRVA